MRISNKHEDTCCNTSDKYPGENKADWKADVCSWSAKTSLVVIWGHVIWKNFQDLEIVPGKVPREEHTWYV